MFSAVKNVTHLKPNTDENGVCRKYLFYPNKTGKRRTEGGLRLQGKYKKSIKSKPLITIITVCLNSEYTLHQCIKSVFNQTYSNIEYIIIDGGSTDGTLETITQYKDFIDYYISEPDTGLYAGMNKGLSLAFGDYILLLNSDDWYTVDCVDKLVKAKYYSCRDVVSSLAQYVDALGNTVNILRHMPFDDSVRIRMPLRHETMLISYNIYDSIGRYDVNYKIIADLDFTIKLFDSGYTLYELQRPLLFFRNTGISNNANRSALETDRILIIKKQFPHLTEEEVLIFKNTGDIKPEQLIKLTQKYPHKRKMLMTLWRFMEDRRRNMKKWKNINCVYPAGADQSPKISVILPFYNAQSTIGRCINSVLSQKFNDFELICINDFSPDGSQKIVEDLISHDERIILIINEKNMGLGASRNRGIKLARGNYIFHIDPDDTIPSNALSILHEYAENNNSEMVKGAYLREQMIQNEPSKKSITRNKFTAINTDLHKTPQLLDTTEGHWSYLYRAEFAKKVPYPTDLKMGQDSIFIVSAIIMAKKITIINDMVYNYRSNPSSAMNTFNFRKYMDALEWRRRAWHLTNDANMKKIGDKFLQSYWDESFFTGMSYNITKIEIDDFFRQFRFVFAEINIPSFNNKTSPFLKKLFKLILDNQDNGAYQMLVNAAKKKHL
jgi:glycosyltransferase involved in cell wall biosynthesis